MKSFFALAAFVVVVASAAEIKESSAPKPTAISELISVTIRSDGETWVSIADVLAPRKFEGTTIKVPPGDYEVVGRRRHHRDVRETVRVRPGSAPVALTIICTVTATGKR